MWNQKIIQMNLHTKQNRLTNTEKKIYGYQGEGQIRSTGLTDTKYLYKVDKQQRFTV